MTTDIILPLTVTAGLVAALAWYKLACQMKTWRMFAQVGWRLLRQADRNCTVRDGTLMQITYTTPSPYSITVPYESDKRINMLPLTVQLVRQGTAIDITHQPGVPYGYSAHALGGEYIVAHNYDSESSHIYPGEVCPGYCPELYEDEDA